MRRGRGMLVLLWVAGIALLSLLRIPQLSLYAVYPLIVTALVSALAALVYLRYGAFLAALFGCCMAMLAYAMEIEGDGVMITCTVIGVLLAQALMRKAPWPAHWQVAMGCLVCVLVLMIGGTLLPMVRKGMGLMEALKYAAAHELPVLAAVLVGSMSATLWGGRKNA